MRGYVFLLRQLVTPFFFHFTVAPNVLKKMTNKDIMMVQFMLLE